MSRVIRAAVCRAFGAPLAIEELRLADPARGEVQVDVEACAICHSDVSYADGLWGGDLPAVWGHEAVGTVTKTGPDVEIDVGQRVVVTLIRSCGDCVHCSKGHFVACTGTFALDDASPLIDTTGAPIAHGLRTAAFAEAVVVHESQVVPIPADLPSAPASLLACGVITGVGAVRNTAQVEADTSVVVIGCGGVGLNVVQGAKLAGATVIVAIDLEPSKLDVARNLGATHLIDPTTTDAVSAVEEATAGALADYVFVAVGSKAAVQSSYELVGAMGAAVMVGMPATGVMSEFEPGSLAGMNQRILGSKMGTANIERDIPELVASYLAGDLQLDPLVSATFPLEAINEAMDQVRAGTALRNVIVFDS